ncbi:MAG: DUF1453 domain-containing protein [Stenotrophomonas sp.]
MPLLLALPLALLVFVALLLLLWPLALWQRFRSGSARRPALAWRLRLNLWLTLFSVALLAVFALVAQLWWPGAAWQAGAGLLAGLAVGALGYALTRFEATPGALFYTPNVWLVLALTALVLARVVAGLIHSWQALSGGPQGPLTAAMGHNGMLALAALLLGYAGMYGWLLDRRLRRHLRYRGYDRSPR